jgi:hypothetical protein
MKKVYAQVFAFDKNSGDSMLRTVIASTKESFNQQIIEFESEVPFEKWYMEIIADDVLDEDQLLIVEDYDVN